MLVRRFHLSVELHVRTCYARLVTPTAIHSDARGEGGGGRREGGGGIVGGNIPLPIGGGRLGGTGGSASVCMCSTEPSCGGA
jgi:hypothetical protein